jgi:2-oxoglutarate dehydrogenase E1 component
MSTDLMQQFLQTSALNAGSMSYLEELYENYLQNPQSVDAVWRSYFDQLPKVNGAKEIPHLPIQEQMLNLSQSKTTRIIDGGADISVLMAHERKQIKVIELINAYRMHGHQQAKLDPLNLDKRPPSPVLNLSYYGLHDSDLDTNFNTDGLDGIKRASLREIHQKLQQIYCSTIGSEYMYITNTHEQEWIRDRLENTDRATLFSNEDRKRILQKLTAAEGIEEYLHTKYVGQKRFSLEGGDALIPLIDQVIRRAAQHDVQETLFGMAHRGRLNVLINILGKVPRELFGEFEGKHRTDLDSGDVKYHQGFSANVRTEKSDMHLALAFNPSHLEIVSPVVEGSARARQDRRKDDFHHSKILPFLIHGDAAFIGQGVVMETFNLSQTRFYKTGGSVHVVINNQVGFTTSNPEDARSTQYCTDIAKMIEAPIFHVDADDAEAVVFIAQLALDYRMQFAKDVVIDLVCYRRHGHNEADEPSVTQPVMYQAIKQHLTPRAIYAQELVKQAVITAADADAMKDNYIKALDQGDCVVAEKIENAITPMMADWKPFTGVHWTDNVSTVYNLDELKVLGQKITTMPSGFKLQTQVGKMVEQRIKMAAGEVPADWGFAENLAYATLLEQGKAVRLSGQDCGRGTFAHRHAVYYDQNTNDAYIPLQHLEQKQASFTVIDSTLSEEAVMAFEYGYATAEPHALVLWEGQFGDFANGAQVVIDQFITSGEAKWGRNCGLTLLLPHGYEGMGPEHSSARLERYLQLCAKNNIQVCVPTTPAQVYHMLRRQILGTFRKPLIVMTPKSLLRHKLAVSSLEELADGHFQMVIGEIDKIKPEKVRKVIICCGKVYYDLLAKRRERDQQDIAIIRLEQLYPFPHTKLMDLLASYIKVKEVVWCQEEPRNQGAWFCIRHRLESCLQPKQVLVYAGRKSSASPAAGYLSEHLKEQAALVEEALV